MTIIYFVVSQIDIIKDNLKLFNNTHVFEPNFSEKKKFSFLSRWQLDSDWPIHFCIVDFILKFHVSFQKIYNSLRKVDQSVRIQLISSEEGEGFSPKYLVQKRECC